MSYLIICVKSDSKYILVQQVDLYVLDDALIS